MNANTQRNLWFLNKINSIARQPRRAVVVALLCLGSFGSPVRGQDPYLALTNHPLDTNVSLGVTISFAAYGSTTKPPLIYQWQHAGTNLPGATSSTLLITNLSIAHAGGYLAMITNSIGGFTNTRTAILTVNPTFTKITSGPIANDEEGSISGSWADYDNDRFPDLFVANSMLGGSTRNTLYHNLGGTNFVRVTASPFTTDFLRVWAAAWADYDEDGYLDLIAANLDGGTTAQRLYRNNGDGTFMTVVDTALRSDSARSTCPWWIDYDNDGLLDLFMGKGMYLGPLSSDCLFRNEGDGRFRKMTAAEVGPILNDQLRSFVCFSSDYDHDGRQELSVIHDPSDGSSPWTNMVTWRPQSDGTFAKTTQTGISEVFIWRWWADYNNDGWLDAFSTDTNALPALFRSLGGGAFTNVTEVLQMTSPVTYPGPAWGDYDNDGWLDLYFTAANTAPALIINGFFHNNRDGTFTQILDGSPVWDSGRMVMPSWVDYDNDGFLDLFVAAGDAQPRKNLLYRNNGNTNRWLKVKLDGRASNRSGIHAKVRAQATINGQTFWQMREITCENAFAAQNGLLAHFGLGDATNVTTLRIEWPSGIVQELTNVLANQFLTVVESQVYTGPAPAISGASHGAGGLQLAITEPTAPARYVLEASSDLVKWTKLMARTSTGGTANLTDTATTHYPQRFYRLQVP